MPAKKAAKKTTAKKAAKKGAGIPIILPIACINAAQAQYMSCLKKGVDPALCMKRLIKNLQNCFLHN